MSHHLLQGVAEGAESGGKGGDPQAKLIHSLPFPERDGLKLRLEPPHACVPHAAVALVLQPDRLPGRHGAALANQHGVHLWRGRAKQGGERLLVLAPGDAVILDRVPQACSLQVHLHHHRPIGVLPPLQHREDEAGAAAAAALAHHLAMHNDLSASTPNSATPAAWRAPSLFGRRSDGLAGGLSRGSALIRWWWSVAGVLAITGHCSALLL